MQNSAWTLPELCSLFSAHLFEPLEHYPDLIDNFFVARNLEATQLLSRVQHIVLRGGNILVVGDRGVGKTSFLKWFLNRSRFAAQLDSHVTRSIDMKTEVGSIDRDRLLASMQMAITEATIDYLAKCHNRPCNDERMLLNQDRIDSAYRKATSQLNKADPTESKLLLFIDDIDYLDFSHFHELLARLKPVLSSTNACVILAARKPHANSLGGHRDMTIAQFFDPQSTVTLSHLSVSSVLDHRIAAMRGEETTIGALARTARHGLEKLYNALAELLTGDSTQLVAHHTVDRVPFTNQQLHFIQEISNGNVGHMLFLSKRFLEYMAVHGSELEQDQEGHLVIGRERLVNEMAEGVGYNDKYASLRIIDLHRRKSHSGTTKAQRKRDGITGDEVDNSLYVCLLETIMECGAIDETRRIALRKFGFSDGEINEGIVELKEMGMVEDKKLVEMRSASESLPIGKEFELTRRGKYYMEWLLHWDCYIDRFGVSHHHELGISVSQKSMVARALQEFAVALCVAWTVLGDIDRPGKFKVNKVAFCEAFHRIASSLLRRANRTDRVQVLVVNSDRIEELLSEWRVVAVHGIEHHRCFAFKVSAVQTLATQKGIEWSDSFVFDQDDVLKFVTTHCQPETGS